MRTGKPARKIALLLSRSCVLEYEQRWYSLRMLGFPSPTFDKNHQHTRHVVYTIHSEPQKPSGTTWKVAYNTKLKHEAYEEAKGSYVHHLYGTKGNLGQRKCSILICSLRNTHYSNGTSLRIRVEVRMNTESNIKPTCNMKSLYTGTNL